MRREKVTLTTVGSDGSAAADNAYDRISLYGWIFNVFIAPGAGQATGIDVSIVEQMDGNERTILTATNITTATDYPLLMQAKDSSGTLITGMYVVPSITGELLIRVTQGNNEKTVNVYFAVDDNPAR